MEFKCAAYPIVGTIKCLEIQRGAKSVRVVKYSAEHGCTSGCSLHLSEACKQPVDPEQKRGVKGDSWFGHVRLADNFGQQGIRAMLKINTLALVTPRICTVSRGTQDIPLAGIGGTINPGLLDCQHNLGGYCSTVPQPL
jgi:hypothetical protein